MLIRQSSVLSVYSKNFADFLPTPLITLVTRELIDSCVLDNICGDFHDADIVS